MKVVAKYEVLETKALNEVEIYGIEFILNKTFPEWDDNIECIYQETCLQPVDRLVIQEGEVSRIGMASGRVVFEIDLLDQETEIATGESLMYWADAYGGEFKLTEIGG
jgi:hypothetical protein